MVLFVILFGLVMLMFAATPFILAFQVGEITANYLGLTDWYNRKLFFQRTDPSVVNFLEKHFQFYQKLSAEDKTMFARRVQKFIDSKTFEGREGLEVSTDMEALIGAAAIQITFGHPSVYFTHFHTIIIYPDNYYSPVTESQNQGEVHSSGIIVLSWKKLVEGYIEHRDGRNLGLHEMAHALRITDSITNQNEYDFLDDTLLYQFNFYAKQEMDLIANGEESFFRSYAATNYHEFFAVAIENFFERPDEFKQFHPDLYTVTKELLNQ